MVNVVVEGAKVKCAFGAALSNLAVTSNTQNSVRGKKIATINDFSPNQCIMPFGICNSALNPQVVAASAAGSPPPPCSPEIIAPWSPGSVASTISNIPVLLQTDMTSCVYAPEGISIIDPNQTDLTSL